jgi:putative SOS response-associated peptidase YedK
LVLFGDLKIQRITRCIAQGNDVANRSQITEHEPRYEAGNAVSWKIESPSDEPLGIVSSWKCRSNGPEGQSSISFLMLTISASDHLLMERFQKPEDEKRMAIVLRPDDHASWLHAPTEQVASFLQQYPADALRTEPAPKPSVSRAGKGESASKSLF